MAEGSSPSEGIEFSQFMWPLLQHNDLGVYSASNINVYQEIFLGGKMRRPARKANNQTAIYKPIG
jgi:hypothetical protein